MPADPGAVSAYLTERASACSPATVRMDRASIAAAHRATGAANPCEHEAVRRVLQGIGRARKVAGRGQVQGLDWRAADLAAGLAANGGSVAGLRDAALILVGSDALLRVSELAALDVGDVQRQADGSGTVTVRRSKTDQEGRGHVRYLGPPTVAAVQRWLARVSITDGAMFRAVNKAEAAGGRLGVRSIRRIIQRRADDAGVAGRVSGHSLRVGVFYQKRASYLVAAVRAAQVPSAHPPGTETSPGIHMRRVAQAAPRRIRRALCPGRRRPNLPGNGPTLNNGAARLTAGGSRRRRRPGRRRLKARHALAQVAQVAAHLVHVGAQRCHVATQVTA